MEDDVIIIEVEPKKFDIVDELGKYSFKLDFFREFYTVNQAITRKPQFLAIRELKGDRVEYVFKIDPVRSNFEKGLIFPQGEPIRAMIPLRVKDRESTQNVVWYTSFRTLVTHNSTSEFSREITRVKSQDEKILCNGYYCIHHEYCRFFNKSPNLIIKGSEAKD
jgi:hypothetical protein